jgi:hypothetical protein
MNPFNIFAYLSVTIDLLANVPYAYGVAKGTIRTHPMTWLIWTLLTFVIAVVQYNEGAGGGGWMLITTTCFNLAVTILSLRGGIGLIDRKDYAVLLVCTFFFPLYFYFHQPFWTALVITLVDCISFIPMIRQSFRDPHGESARFQWLMVAAYSSSLLALENYTLAICLFPAAMVAMHGFTGLVIVIFRKKHPNQMSHLGS